jgi:hypothetical protein
MAALTIFVCPEMHIRPVVFPPALQDPTGCICLNNNAQVKIA